MAQPTSGCAGVMVQPCTVLPADDSSTVYCALLALGPLPESVTLLPHEIVCPITVSGKVSPLPKVSPSARFSTAPDEVCASAHVTVFHAQGPPALPCMVSSVPCTLSTNAWLPDGAAQVVRSGGVDRSAIPRSPVERSSAVERSSSLPPGELTAAPIRLAIGRVGIGGAGRRKIEAGGMERQRERARLTGDEVKARCGVDPCGVAGQAGELDLDGVAGILRPRIEHDLGRQIDAAARRSGAAQRRRRDLRFVAAGVDVAYRERDVIDLAEHLLIARHHVHHHLGARGVTSRADDERHQRALHGVAWCAPNTEDE